MKFSEFIRADGISVLLILCIAVSVGCQSGEQPTSPTSLEEFESAGMLRHFAPDDSVGVKRPDAGYKSLEKCTPTGDSAVSALHGKILIRVLEAYREPGKWNLHLFTDYEFGCANFSIANCFRARGRRMDVAISGIYRPDVCATAFGPATASIELPIHRDGWYVLRFRYEEARDAYLLFVRSGKVRIRPLRSTFTEVSDLHG